MSGFIETFSEYIFFILWKVTSHEVCLNNTNFTHEQKLNNFQLLIRYWSHHTMLIHSHHSQFVRLHERHQIFSCFSQATSQTLFKNTFSCWIFSFLQRFRKKYCIILVNFSLSIIFFVHYWLFNFFYRILIHCIHNSIFFQCHFYFFLIFHVHEDFISSLSL